LTLYTLSRQDFFDYLRCPRIVAFRTQGIRVREFSPRSPMSIIKSIEKGKIGELTTKVGLQELTKDRPKDDKAILRSIRAELASLSRRSFRTPQEELEGVIRRSLEGTKRIADQIREIYGVVDVVGRGEVKSPFLPHMILPDFVVMTSRRKTLSLIEVKNTEKANVRGDEFQAAFYNAISKEPSAVIVKERKERGRTEIAPQTCMRVDPETLLVYPILGEFKVVKNALTIEKNLVEGIWEAKQLGMIRKAPMASGSEYCSRCPYREHCNRDKWDELEPAKPLALIAAKGAIETGSNLDLEFLKRYSSSMVYQQSVLSALDRKARIAELRFILKTRSFAEASYTNREDRGESLYWQTRDQEKIGLVALALGLDEEHARDLVSTTIAVDRKRIFREMAGEFQKWRPLLRKDYKAMVDRVASYGLRYCTFPSHSEDLINRSWRKWD